MASSMSLYGEGLYRSPDGVLKPGAERALDQLRTADWELHDESGAALVPVPTPETKAPSLSSVYALSKFDQERLCLMIGRAYNIPTVALRFFNVFGTRQALSNPYTGVLAIFAARLLNNNPPLIFEDGLQRRDFVSVYDVVQACRLALDVPAAAGCAFNVGSGQSYTVREVAAMMAAILGKDIEPDVCGKYRVGDIRHCFADITLRDHDAGIPATNDARGGAGGTGGVAAGPGGRGPRRRCQRRTGRAGADGMTGEQGPHHRRRGVRGHQRGRPPAARRRPGTGVRQPLACRVSSTTCGGCVSSTATGSNCRSATSAMRPPSPRRWPGSTRCTTSPRRWRSRPA